MSVVRSVGWDELERRQLASPEQVPDLRVPEELTVALAESPASEGPRLVFRGLLRNPTEDEAVIIASDLGENSLGFWVDFDEEAPVEYDGPVKPPSPPMPVEVKVPANTAIGFTQGLALWQYDYEGTPTVRINYGFSLFGREGISGHVLVELPPRPDRPEAVPGGPPMPG